MERFSKILKRRLSPGIMIFDMEGHLLYSSQETREMLKLAYNEPADACCKLAVPAEVATLCAEMKQRVLASTTDCDEDMPHGVINCQSGLVFSLRAFVVGDHGDDKSSTHIMVLMEKIVEKRKVDYDRARNDYLLSRREMDVLKLTCKGCRNRDISEQLFISEDTVKGHLKKIMQKMGVNSRNEIIVALQ